MPMRKYKPEQIVTLLRPVEVELANAKTTPQACKEAQITAQTHYRWREEFGGLKLDHFLGDRNGLLFPSTNGTTPVSYHNLLKRHITSDFERLGIKEPGKAAHSFRRFRASVLGMRFVAEDLKKFWLGHENNDITAQYAEQMFEMNEWRQTEAAKIGLGFNVSAFVPKPIVRKVRRNRKEVEVAVSS